MESVNVICIFGFDEGRIAKLKPWIAQDKEHYLIILVEDESLLFSFPSTSQVRLNVVKPENEDEVLRKIAWEFLFLPCAYEAKTEKGKQVLAKLSDIQAEILYFASDFSDQGELLFANLQKNLQKLPQWRKGSSLFGAYKNVPAIISGAGPSLMKNSSVLRELSDKALIFAGGAAIHALNQIGIPFHFGAQVDAHSSHDLKTRKAICQAPLFCTLRTDPELLSSAKGPLLWIEGTGNYPLEKWVTGAAASFDGGWTVGTFCTALAYHMGCNPIIFVGMDLSCSKNVLYASGIEKKNAREKLVSIKNQKGEMVYSQRDWLFAAAWIEKFAKAHPETLFLNATEGGLGFQGIADIPLKEAPLTEPLKIEIPELPKMGDEGKDRLEQVKTSLAVCKGLVEKILSEMEAIFPKPPSESGVCALLEKELSEQLAVEHILEPIWKIWQHPISRHNSAGPYGLFLNQLLLYRTLIGNHLK